VNLRIVRISTTALALWLLAPLSALAASRAASPLGPRNLLAYSGCAFSIGTATSPQQMFGAFMGCLSLMKLPEPASAPETSS
jgi:hypothetical protein